MIVPIIYYKVCISCGTCIDFASIQIPEFNYIKNATVKRFYKKTNYLKLKMNKIEKYLSNGNMNHIQKEFIKYDNLYSIAGKRIKYDFILGQILISMGKMDVYNLYVKKFKNKLEKKRLKEFNQIIKIN
jgi:polyferredoxin